ncbi:MAG TPA: lipoprotein-releasing ABC transporter permease subunit [Rhizomicrobium sp.]
MTKLAQPDALAAPIAAIAAAETEAAPPLPRTSTRPFAAFEWMIALRYLRAKRRESFISVITIISLLGITLGVATLIIVMSVMNGFRVELLSKILGFNGPMNIEGVQEGLKDFDAVAARVRGVPGIVRVAPVIDGQVIATANGITRGAQILGMRRGDLAALSVLTTSLTPDAAAGFRSLLDGFRDGDSVIVGVGVARRFGLFPGAKLTLTAPRGEATPFGMTPRVKTYTVAGTFDAGMSEYNNNVVFMLFDEAQLYFNFPDAASRLEINVADPDGVDAMAGPVQRAAGPLARVSSWHDLNLALFDAVKIEHNVMFLILTLIVLVASLNVIAGLIMLVKDKSGDIAILRTMGATRGSMMRVFLIAGASIGIVGTTMGLLVGALIAAFISDIEKFVSWLAGESVFNPDIYFLTHMPSKVEPFDVAAVAGISLLLSLLATLYPSWRAARLDPVEALRYE